MDSKEKAEFEAQSQTLRTQLKKWENEWAKDHAGSKPGREDIKADGDIAQKYKQYNKLRDIISGKVPPPKKEGTVTRKRKASATAPTPSKRTKHSETPSRNHPLRDNDDLMSTPPISRKLFSPVPATSIGPTPHRDGRVLGLFDLLVEKELGTPSKLTDTARPREGGHIQATPRKRSQDSDPSSAIKLRGTPTSSSKREVLSTFMTPLKKPTGNDQAGGTPTSASKLQFSTPAFLRRNPLPAVNEKGNYTSPQPVRLPRKPLVRGLSAIVASLRKVEEEKLDDDLDALREIEMEEALPKPVLKPQPKVDILALDSQVQHLPLGGFDDEAMYDSPEEEQLDQNGQPPNIFKKKGQKRTTRLVNMKPSRVKRPALQECQDGVDDAMSETQFASGNQEAALVDIGSGSDYEDSKAEDEKKDIEKKKAVKKDGPVKKVAKKVNALAHANFRRLKLKNSGAKGGPGYNSRFRRRR